MTSPSALAAFVRRHDPDRFLTALFAPAPQRETLFALYAFNHEIARASEVASQPALALIRLQWWREVVEGADRRHEVAIPLAAELAVGRLSAADLLALIDAREQEAEGLSGLAEWQDFVDASAGRLATVAGGVLGAQETAIARLQALGAGYGVAGLLLRGSGSRRARVAGPAPAELAEWGRARLGRPQPLPAALISAGLVGVLGRRDLRHRRRPGPRGLRDRLAVTWAAWRRLV